MRSAKCHGVAKALKVKLKMKVFKALRRLTLLGLMGLSRPQVPME